MGNQTETTAQTSGVVKLDVKRTTLIGLAFMTISMFWAVYTSYIPLFLQDFGLNQILEGLIIALDKILALLMLPVIGYFSDKFPDSLRRRYGRRVPFIIIGSIAAALVFILLNLAHNLAYKNGVYSGPGFMICMIVLIAFFMNLYRTPAVSLMPDVTPKRVRSSANAVINIMGAVGMVVAMGLSLFFKKTEDAGINSEGQPIIRLLPGSDNWGVVISTAALMLLCALVYIFFIKENKFIKEKNEYLISLGLDEEKPEEKGKKIKLKTILKGLSKPQRTSLLFILISVAMWYMAYTAVTVWFSRYSFNVLGEKNFELPLTIGNIAAFATFVPAIALGKKLGRKKAVLIGVSMLIAGFSLGILLQFTASADVLKLAMYPVFVLVGAGWAAINVHSFVMSVELSDEKTNGVFTGLYYSFAFAAQAVTPILSSALFSVAGGGEKGLKLLLPYALVFSLLAFISMLFVKHGNSKDKPIEMSK